MSLSEWLAFYERTETRQAARAVRQIGTNGIPFLIAQLRAEDSKTKALLIQCVGQRRLNRVGLSTAGQRRSLAQRGFELLGPEAKPAVPELIEILKNPSTCMEAAAALTWIGDDGLFALTNAISCSSADVHRAGLGALRDAGAKRDVVFRTKVAPVFVPPLLSVLNDSHADARAIAAETLALFDHNRAAVVAALAKLLHDPELAARCAAVSSLGVIGSDAKAALPEMVEYAKRAQGRSERNNARYWIERIEPGAAAELTD